MTTGEAQMNPRDARAAPSLWKCVAVAQFTLIAALVAPHLASIISTPVVAAHSSPSIEVPSEVQKVSSNNPLDIEAFRKPAVEWLASHMERQPGRGCERLKLPKNPQEFLHIA